VNLLKCEFETDIIQRQVVAGDRRIYAMSKESDINNAQWAKIEGKFFQLHPHAMLRFVVHVV